MFVRTRCVDLRAPSATKRHSVFSRILVACFTVFVAFASLSCKSIQIQNGQLPSGTEAAAQAFAGLYQGRAYFKPGTGPYRNAHAQTIQVTVRDRQVFLSSSTDWLGEHCGSSVGLLKWIELSDDFHSLNRASFEFNPGRCAGKVSAREFILTSFGRSKSGQIKIYYWITAQPGPVNSPAASSDFVGELVQTQTTP